MPKIIVAWILPYVQEMVKFVFKLFSRFLSTDHFKFFKICTATKKSNKFTSCHKAKLNSNSCFDLTKNYSQLRIQCWSPRARSAQLSGSLLSSGPSLGQLRQNETSFLSLAIRATKTVFRRKLYMGRKTIVQDFVYMVEGESNIGNMCHMETNFPCEMAWKPFNQQVISRTDSN